MGSSRRRSESHLRPCGLRVAEQVSRGLLTEHVLRRGPNLYHPCAVNSMSFLDFGVEILPLTRSKDIGLIGMKVLADGRITRQTEACLRYTMSLPISCVILGVRLIEELEEDLRIARSFRPTSYRPDVVVEAVAARSATRAILRSRLFFP